MTFHTDKALKSKIVRKQKVYIAAKDVNSRRKILKIKDEKFSSCKRPNFLGHLNSGSCVQNTKTLLQNIFCLQNITTLKTSASRNY